MKYIVQGNLVWFTLVCHLLVKNLFELTTVVVQWKLKPPCIYSVSFVDKQEERSEYLQKWLSTKLLAYSAEF